MSSLIAEDQPRTSHNESAYTDQVATSYQEQPSEEEFERFWDELAQEVEADAQTPYKQEEPKPELTFEEQVDNVRKIVNSKASHKEILRKILVRCDTLCELGELERTVQGYPEYAYAAQNPYRLIIYLVDAGGLEKVDLDEELQPIAEERKEGLSVDELDDLIATYGFITTEAGRAVARELEPKKRINELLNHIPERFNTYIDLLDFCREPKTMTAIDKFLGSKDLSQFTSLNTGTSVGIKPSVFVDKMERAGGIVWKDGWVVTSEGKEFLETIVKSRAER